MPGSTHRSTLSAWHTRSLLYAAVPSNNTAESGALLLSPRQSVLPRLDHLRVSNTSSVSEPQRSQYPAVLNIENAEAQMRLGCYHKEEGICCACHYDSHLSALFCLVCPPCLWEVQGAGAQYFSCKTQGAQELQAGALTAAAARRMVRIWGCCSLWWAWSKTMEGSWGRRRHEGLGLFLRSS